MPPKSAHEPGKSTRRLSLRIHLKHRIASEMAMAAIAYFALLPDPKNGLVLSMIVEIVFPVFPGHQLVGFFQFAHPGRCMRA